MTDFELDEVVLNAFTDSAQTYFDETLQTPNKLSIPYLVQNEDIVSDYIGIIGVSGVKQGYVLIASEREPLEHLVNVIFDEEATEEFVNDIAGELVNTISGNVREYFGDEFLISVPIIVSGKFESVKFPLDIPIFAVPIEFSGFKIRLIIGVK